MEVQRVKSGPHSRLKRAPRTPSKRWNRYAGRKVLDHLNKFLRFPALELILICITQPVSRICRAVENQQTDR